MYKFFGKRLFDILFSGVAILLLIPVWIIVGILIKIDSPGPVIYSQKRVKKGNVDFFIHKFRTMRVDADKLGLLTTSNRDSRITKLGYFLRKYKIDELPQFFNIFTGDMSFVGPRAEVRKYVDFYTPEQMYVLDVRPGLTDFAVLEYYFKEEEMLRNAGARYEEIYINDVMVEKNKLNLKYIDSITFSTDIGIILKTITRIIFRK